MKTGDLPVKPVWWIFLFDTVRGTWFVLFLFSILTRASLFEYVRLRCHINGREELQRSTSSLPRSKQTMYHQNPFSSWSSASQSPSVYGAVPYSSPQAADSDMVSFQLTAFNPDLFNCTVIDSRKRPVYQFVTDRQNPGYTVLKSADGKNIALIEWQTPPQIEIRGIVSKQRVKDWMPLSSNKR